MHCSDDFPDIDFEMDKEGIVKHPATAKMIFHSCCPDTDGCECNYATRRCKP